MKPRKGQLQLKKVGKSETKQEVAKRQLESFLTKRQPSKKHGLTCQRDFEERHVQPTQQEENNSQEQSPTKILKEDNSKNPNEKKKEPQNFIIEDTFEELPEIVDPNTYRTASERAFYSLKEKRLKEKVENEEVESHRDKIEKQNKYLEKLPVHFDIPRVGPG